MRDDLHHIIAQMKGAGDPEVFEPVIYHLTVKSEREALKDFLARESGLSFFDELYGQLKELVKAKHPKKQHFTEAEIKDLIAAHLDGTSIGDYGCWVFYPWNKNIIHLLPEDEFIEVRTNRNRNKITLKEAEKLRHKKVGVIGLSVGQSVSVTMAMERSFGEIRLADFDKLELTNLNRIRTGLANLGLSKVIAVAREIKEIDPFLKITTFTEGITEENIDAFFTEGGKLDAVIDECDGLDIKVLCRVKAKELQVPVLMEASDRGTIDVERFDLEPNRPLLHGFIDHLDLSKIKGLKTNEEKVPYLLPIAGIETLSKKMKASMLEIGQTLTTWPQLSSAVTLGGGITADTYRRIMLNEFNDSGRYFVDTEDILKDRNKPTQDTIEKESITPLDKEKVDVLVSNIALHEDEADEISEELAKELAAAAIVAPSGGNNQPWLWRFHHGGLVLIHDRSRSVSFSDYGNMAAMISFGAAIENVAIQAYKNNLTCRVSYFPVKDDHQVIARLSFAENQTDLIQQEIKERGLSEFIFTRHTNRTTNEYQKLGSDQVSLLKGLVPEGSGMNLVVFEDRDEIIQLAAIVSACERIRIMHPQGHRDFYEDEVRWSDKESRETGDGIDIATIELTPSELAGMKLASDKGVMSHLRKWGGGRGFEKLSKEAVETCSAVGLVQIPDYGYEHFINGGRLVQRIWLQATAAGLSIHPVSAGLFMFARLFHGKAEGFSPTDQKELQTLHNAFHSLLPGNDNYTNLFMFRIFKSEKSVVKSYRRPLEDVYL